MKIFISLFLLSMSTFASAEFCTSAIKDQYSQYEYQNFTRSSYSYDDACFQAITDCRRALADAQSQGRYYNANCLITSSAPTPPPRPPQENLICRTDLLDYWGNTIRQFTAQSWDARSACDQSDEFCRMELSRGRNNGARCLNMGIINQRPNPRPRPQTVVETCQSSRLDPAGMYVEGYTGRAEGPRGSDVKGEACREAMSLCSRELVGRQTCRLER